MPFKSDEAYLQLFLPTTEEVRLFWLQQGGTQDISELRKFLTEAGFDEASQNEAVALAGQADGWQGATQNQLDVLEATVLAILAAKHDPLKSNALVQNAYARWTKVAALIEAQTECAKFLTILPNLSPALILQMTEEMKCVSLDRVTWVGVEWAGNEDEDENVESFWPSLLRLNKLFACRRATNDEIQELLTGTTLDNREVIYAAQVVAQGILSHPHQGEVKAPGEQVTAVYRMWEKLRDPAVSAH